MAEPIDVTEEVPLVEGLSTYTWNNERFILATSELKDDGSMHSSEIWLDRDNAVELAERLMTFAQQTDQ